MFRSTLTKSLAALLATFAFAAVAAASSSAALPEIHNRNLLSETFTGHNVGSFFFELANGDKWDYNSVKISGEISSTGKTLTNVTLQFKEGSEGACYNEHTGSGNALTLAGFQGSLAYVNKSNHSAGVGFAIYLGEGPDGLKVLWAKCFQTVLGWLTLHGGSINTLITPINQYTTDHTLTFNEEKGIQSPSKFVELTGALTYPMFMEWEGGLKQNLGFQGKLTFETPSEVTVEA